MSPVFLEPPGLVWVCPGELKVLAVAGVGRAAIGITSGEGNANTPADFQARALELLRGRGAAIPGDDTGRAWANHVSRQITKAGIEARIVNLDLDRAAGLKDIGDWITRHLVENGKESSAVAATLDDIRRHAELWRETSDGVPDSVQGWQPFPVHLFPEPLREFIVDGAKAISCDQSYVALPTLASVAAAIGTTHRIRLKRAWTEPAIVWCAAVGRSEVAVKSPAQEYALRPLTILQGEYFQEYSEALKVYESEKLQYQKALRLWKARAGSLFV